MPGASWYLDLAGQEEYSQAGSLCSLSCPPISQGSYSQNSLWAPWVALQGQPAGDAAPWKVMARNTAPSVLPPLILFRKD